MNQHLLIKEIYTTLQGEGPSMGKPATFIRLSGCSLRCRYCDSEYAFEGGESLHLQKIVERAKELSCPLVVVTGGEPLDQEHTIDLLEKLHKEGFQVELETAGHRSLENIPQNIRILLDVKTPGSGMNAHHKWDNISYLKSGDVLKFVITDRSDYLWMRDEVHGHWKISPAELWLSPASAVTPQLENYKIKHSGLNPEDLASWVLEDHFPGRLQLPLHRQLWGGQESR